jgi:uncharacterized cupredoxin-like copper-binding protein
MKQRFLCMVGIFLLVLVLSACARTAGSSRSSVGPQQVQITETDFKIGTSVRIFVAGIRYHFVVTNDGKTAHELMIMPKSEGSMTAMSMGNMDKLALASISYLGPGETKALDYIFPASAAGSHPELACYFPGHYKAGMRLATAVKP